MLLTLLRLLSLLLAWLLFFEQFQVGALNPLFYLLLSALQLFQGIIVYHLL